MVEWKEFKIEELADIYNYKRKPLSSIERVTKKGIYPYYGASGIVDYIDNYIFDGNYVLISEDGENLNTRNTPIAFLAKGKFWVNNHSHILKGKKEFINNLLIYFFANLDLTPYITGAVQPKLSKENLLSIPIYLPRSENAQKLITESLICLDDKIDLLNRQNKTLEALAETLFRQWFIEEADESWEVTTLKENTIVFRGLSYKGSGLTNEKNGLPMHNLNSVFEGGGYKYSGIKFYNGEYREKHLVSPGEIIVTNTEQGHRFRLIGFPAIVPDYFGKIGLFSQHIYRLVPNAETYLTNEYLYYLLMEPGVREQIIGATNGSTVNMLAIDGLERPEFKLPPENKIKAFTMIVKDYWKKKTVNQNQIRTLTQLRDTLLPKLMSGEVRVEG